MKAREIIKESSPTTSRIHHLEDLVIWHGYEGAMRAVEILQTISSDPSLLSVKWDGSPAVIFGRDANGAFTLTDKAGFNAKRYDGRPSTARALHDMMLNRVDNPDESRRQFAANMAGVFSVFEAAVPQDFRGYMFGDLLYYSTPSIENGDYVFQPNLVVYSVDSSSTLGQQIGSSVAGVVIHSKITPEGTHVAVDMNELDLSGRLLVMPPVPIETPPEVNQRAIELITNNATKYKSALDNLLDVDIHAANKMKDFNNMLYSYMNARVKSGHFRNLADGFLEWIKTSKSSPAKQERIVNHIRVNYSGFTTLFGLMTTIMKAKNDIITQLDSQPLAVRSQTAGKFGGEGYVVGTGEAKLVNRSGFSAANMAKNN